eukprot:2922340-Prymnesium_polylepis.1
MDGRRSWVAVNSHAHLARRPVEVFTALGWAGGGRDAVRHARCGRARQRERCTQTWYLDVGARRARSCEDRR